MDKVELIPFRGLRYDTVAVGDLSAVISPPYDVITAEEQARYLARSPYNSIRLDYGPELDGDDAGNNRYSRAAAAMKTWLSEGVLAVEERPAIYWCREEYVTPAGVQAVREGFFAALGLVEFSAGVVLPHEKTSPGPKADRLALMEAAEANLSPIFCLYSDPEHEINKLVAGAILREPDSMALDAAGTTHSLWVIDDEQVLAALTAYFAPGKLMIADGHHRYETALAYRDRRRAREDAGGRRPYDYMMVYLSNSDNPGLTIFPLHRLVSGLSPETIAGLPAALAAIFEVEEIDSSHGIGGLLEAMAARGVTHNAFGMHLAGSNSYLLLVARHPKPMLPVTEAAASAAHRSLDVSVLDQVILSQVMGIHPGGANPEASVRFVERAEMDPGEIARSEHQVMILVNPTTMAEVKEVSEAGEKMPKKSTYFYPKPVTGLVFRSFNY